MTLADYLESKAEYIFDNSPRDYYYGVDVRDLHNNREMIIDTLKKGFRELAKIHDDSFSSSEGIEKYQKNEFWGNIHFSWVERPKDRKSPAKMNDFRLYVTFPHWSFANIMLEEANKKFEDIFRVGVDVQSEEIKKPTSVKLKDKGTKIFKFEVSGQFSSTTNPKFFPSNLLFLNPTISEFYKYNMFSMFKNLDMRDFLYDNNYIIMEYNEGGLYFGDFIIMRLKSEYANYTDDFSKRLLISKNPKEAGFYAIRLTKEEYRYILKTIYNIKETKKVNDTEVLLKDVLLKYSYLKIKEGNP